MVTPRQKMGLAPEEYLGMLEKLPNLPQELGDHLGSFLNAHPETPAAPVRKAARGGGPPMRKALLADSVEQVEAVLACDPDAAWEPFWDHSVEPPLCLAARLLCDPAIMELLLEHGASVHAVNVNGLSPPELLPSATKVQSLDAWNWDLPPAVANVPAPQLPAPWPQEVDFDLLKCFCSDLPLLVEQPVIVSPVEQAVLDSMQLRDTQEASRRDAIAQIFKERLDTIAQEAQQQQTSSGMPS